MYVTRCTIIHKIVACFRGGQEWKLGRIVQSAGMWRGSMRSTAAILARVQFRIMGPSPHSVILCANESSFRQWVQRSVSAKRMAAHRSFVGMISWITLYHVDFKQSEIGAWCRLHHTRPHGMDGCFWMTRRSGVLLSTVAITRCLLNIFSDSMFPGGLFTPYLWHNVWDRRSSLRSNFSAEGSPGCRSVAISASMPLLLILLIHGASTCGLKEAFCISLRCPAVPSHLVLWVVGVVAGTWKVAPCQMYQLHTVVICCVCTGSGGMIWETYHVFARRHKCTSCTLYARHTFLAYAFRTCSRTARIMHAQLSFVIFSIVVPTVTTRILMWVLNSTPKTVVGAVHFPMARALISSG